MTEGYFINKLITKGFEPISSDERFFEGFLTVEMKDKQGEVTIVNELYKVLPIWMDRGAPITDTHSNRVIGKGINFARTEFTAPDGETYPAIKVTGKIFKNYDLDNEIWSKIKSGEYKGLSFGGATKANRTPMRMKDGSIAYALSSLEHYEVAVCKDPAVPLAIITDYNPLAKSVLHTERRGDKMIVKTCDNFGCFITKPMPDGEGGKGDFAHCESVNQDKRDPSAYCGQIKHDTEKAEKLEHAKEDIDEHIKEMNKQENITKFKIMGHEGQKCPFGDCGHTTGDMKDFQAHTNTAHPRRQNDYSFMHYPKDHPNTKRMREWDKDMAGQKRSQEKKADHSNSMGDQHSMYNQNTGRETWIGQGLPQPKGVYCEQTVENEGKTSRCEEKPVGDLGGRASPPQSSEIKWVDDSPAGVPKNVKDESKQDRKGRHAQKMAFFEYLLEDLSKTLFH